MEIIEMIHEHNMRAGIAISPDTPSTVITDEIANAVDMILVMTVNPGVSYSPLYMRSFYSLDSRPRWPKIHGTLYAKGL
jgi:pentose-5-phosphate-3-epimerase